MGGGGGDGGRGGGVGGHSCFQMASKHKTMFSISTNQRRAHRGEVEIPSPQSEVTGKQAYVTPVKSHIFKCVSSGLIKLN